MKLLRLSCALLLTSACADRAADVGQTTRALSTSLVISQVYGGGGNAGATLDQDFVELHNRGAVPASTAGWAVQYASAANNFSASLYAFQTATIPPGGYLLIALGAAGANGAALPTADDTAAGINMAAGSGKIALLSSTTPLTGCGTAASPCVRADIVDLVGYGSASQAEGAAIATLTNTTGALRNNNGCSETDDNATDFSVGTPAPRSSASAAVTCGNSPVDAGTASPDATATGPDAASVALDATAAADATPAAADAAGITDAGTATVARDASVNADATVVANADAATTIADAGVVIDGGPFEAILNEIKVNPPSSDDGFEYIELRGSGTLPSFTYVMSIEGDASSTQGRVNYLHDLGGVAFGTNGLILIRAPGAYTPPVGTTVIDDPRLATSAIQNGTESIVLVQSPTAINFSTGNDGGVSLFPFAGTSLLDSVGWRAPTDGGVSGVVFGGVDISFAILPDGVTRFIDDTTATSSAAWFAARLSIGMPELNTYDTSLARTLNFPSDGTQLTPGAPNEGTRGAPALDAGFRDATVRTDTGIENDDAGPADDDASETADAAPARPDAAMAGSPDAEAMGAADAASTTADTGGKVDAGRRLDAGNIVQPTEEGGCTSIRGESPAALLLIIGLALLRRRRR